MSPPKSEDGAFGTAGGAGVENAGEILNDIDARLNSGKPPAIELILAEHDLQPNWWSNLGRFGHVLIRYQSPSTGQQVVMNICNSSAVAAREGKRVEDCHVVNFLNPEEYFFGTNDWDGANEQGGVYNRAFCGLRIEHVSNEVLEALDAYYLALVKKEATQTLDFMLFGQKLLNTWNSVVPFRTAPTTAVGNCAFWTSAGLAWSGLLQRPRIFPKAIFCDLLERELQRDDTNVHVVYYHRVEDCPKKWGPSSVGFCFLSPFQVARAIEYWDLRKFADLHVVVPAASAGEPARRAEIEQGPAVRPTHPTLLRNTHAGMVAGLSGVYLYRSKEWSFSRASNGWARLAVVGAFLGVQAWLY